jgi:hypothetical protein
MGGIDTATGTASSWTAPASDWAQSLMMPYIKGGEKAQTQLSDLLAAPTDKFSYDSSNVEADKGYQFTLAQGMKALEQSAAARGQSLSGGQQKAIAQFSQGNAATYQNQFFNQALSTFDANRDTTQQRIANLFGQTSQGMQGGQFAGKIGLDQAEYASDAEQRAAALKAQLGLQASGMVGNARTGAANTTAASILASTNARNTGITGATNDIGQAIFLNQLLKKPPAQATSNYGIPGVNGQPGIDLAEYGG